MPPNKALELTAFSVVKRGIFHVRLAVEHILLSWAAAQLGRWAFFITNQHQYGYETIVYNRRVARTTSLARLQEYDE